jgi:hypothetical protein
MFPDITIELHTFVILPASADSSKRTLNLLKQVMKFYRSTSRQDRPYGNPTPDVNCDLAGKVIFLNN